MSRYDADDVYCLPGTALLKNKVGITDQALLDQYEADFTTVRLLELAQNSIQGVFDLAHLCKTHEYLFQDIYEWAGEIRRVDIIRGDSRFCNFRQIQAYADTVFSSLKAENHLKGLSKEIFAARTRTTFRKSTPSIRSEKAMAAFSACLYLNLEKTLAILSTTLH